MSNFRDYQALYGDQHRVGNQHAAHYCSVEELEYYGVAQRTYRDSGANYRMVAAPINQSQHRQMDGYLMDMHAQRQRNVGGFTYGDDGRYVSPQMLVDRVENKFHAAVATGAWENERYRNFLMQSARRLDMDMRMFNGHV